MAHIKVFEMKFEFKFRVNDNLMAKYFMTTLKGDSITWYFSFPSKSINSYKQIVSQSYFHFKHNDPSQVIIFDLVHTIQGPNERFEKFSQRFQKLRK